MTKIVTRAIANKIKKQYEEATKTLPAGLKVTKTTVDVVSSDPGKDRKTAVISNSDRALYRKCRRAWDLSSHLRRSLAPIQQNSNFWFGSAMHHVFEDLDGYRLYESPQEAFDDYYQATKRFFGEDKLPVEHKDLRDLAHAMLTYYTELWLKARNRDPLKTLYIDGVPQVEVPLEFEIPVNPQVLKRSGYDRAVCRFIIDRIVEDEYGILWILDRKTCKSFTNFDTLQLDPQISQYLLGVQILYDRPFGGFIYMQHLKAACNYPRVLKNGDLSVDAKQGTNYMLYRRALIEKYKTISLAPEKQQQFLNDLLEREQPEADPFVRRDTVTRNGHVIANEAKHIIADTEDMLDNPRIYHSPNFLCTEKGCNYYGPCVEMERGEDFELSLKLDYATRDYEDRSSWTKYLKIGNKQGKERRKTATVV